MPVEIAEMVVSVRITEKEEQKETKNPLKKQINKIFDQKALVEEAVEQVLAILEYKNER